MGAYSLCSFDRGGEPLLSLLLIFDILNMFSTLYAADAFVVRALGSSADVSFEFKKAIGLFDLSYCICLNCMS